MQCFNKVYSLHVIFLHSIVCLKKCQIIKLGANKSTHYVAHTLYCTVTDFFIFDMKCMKNLLFEAKNCIKVKGVRKMHSWAKLSKVWQSWHVFKRGNKEAKLAKLVHIPIHFWIYYAKQSWQSWDINPLFKTKLAKLRIFLAYFASF